MKSQKTFPVEDRLSNGTYAVGFGKFAYYGLIKILEKYHKALVVAEKEIEVLEHKNKILKEKSKMKTKTKKSKR